MSKKDKILRKELRKVAEKNWNEMQQWLCKKSFSYRLGLAIRILFRINPIKKGRQ